MKSVSAPFSHELLSRHFLLRQLLPGGISRRGVPAVRPTLGPFRQRLPLTQNDLYVARGGHVGVDAPMGPIGPAPHFRRAIHLDVFDDQSVHIESLVVGVRLGVPQQLEQELRRFLGPATLRRPEDFSLSLAPHAAIEASEGNDLLLDDDVL